MLHSTVRAMFVVLLVTIAVPATAQETSGNRLLAPTKAVADAWAMEARERGEVGTRQPSSKSLKALYGTYSVLQGLDMYSTIVARNRGAREVNPMMNLGYTQATAMKAVMAAATIISVRKMEKKNKKAAIATMIAMNVVSAVVVGINFRNAERLK